MSLPKPGDKICKCTEKCLCVRYKPEPAPLYDCKGKPISADIRSQYDDAAQRLEKDAKIMKAIMLLRVGPCAGHDDHGPADIPKCHGHKHPDAPKLSAPRQ